MRPMSLGLIVSYDGTANDDDALMLGRMLVGRRGDTVARVRAPCA